MMQKKGSSFGFINKMSERLSKFFDKQNSVENENPRPSDIKSPVVKKPNNKSEKLTAVSNTGIKSKNLDADTQGRKVGKNIPKKIESKINSNSSQLKSGYNIKETIEYLNEIVKKYHFSSIETQNQFDTSDENELSNRFLTASSWFKDKLNDNSNIESLCIGYDLGSTSTKIVLRFPYNANLGAFAVPAPPSLQADGNPYFWKTQVSCSKNDQFSLIANGTAAYKSSLKLDFLRATEARRSNDLSITDEDIYITAYMALMIRQSLGWLIAQLSKALHGKRLEISANFGLPTERIDNSMSATFLLCCNAAMTLATSDSIISRSAVSDAIEKARHKPKKYVVKIIPEFIGAVYGFFNSTRRRNGQFMLLDIGGLTCDCTCFGFFERDDGTSVIKIFNGRVRNFGSDVVNVAVQGNLGKSDLTPALGSFVAKTLIASRPRIGPHASIWGNEMPVFKIGGGINNNLFQGMFAWAENNLKNSTFKTEFMEEKISIEKNTIDISLAVDGSCDRLLVGLGLSYSNYDLPDWLLSGELNIIPELPRRDLEGLFVGPEQT